MGWGRQVGARSHDNGIHTVPARSGVVFRASITHLTWLLVQAPSQGGSRLGVKPWKCPCSGGEWMFKPSSAGASLCTKHKHPPKARSAFRTLPARRTRAVRPPRLMARRHAPDARRNPSQPPGRRSNGRRNGRRARLCPARVLGAGGVTRWGAEWVAGSCWVAGTDGRAAAGAHGRGEDRAPLVRSFGGDARTRRARRRNRHRAAGERCDLGIPFVPAAPRHTANRGRVGRGGDSTRNSFANRGVPVRHVAGCDALASAPSGPARQGVLAGGTGTAGAATPERGAARPSRAPHAPSRHLRRQDPAGAVERGVPRRRFVGAGQRSASNGTGLPPSRRAGEASGCRAIAGYSGAGERSRRVSAGGNVVSAYDQARPREEGVGHVRPRVPGLGNDVHPAGERTGGESRDGEGVECRSQVAATWIGWRGAPPPLPRVGRPRQPAASVRARGERTRVVR
jgi:hypothetical protein